jgi:hypothetical protein
MHAARLVLPARDNICQPASDGHAVHLEPDSAKWFSGQISHELAPREPGGEDDPAAQNLHVPVEDDEQPSLKDPAGQLLHV